MIGQIALVKNWREIKRIEDTLGIDPPDEVFEFMPFGFHLDDVKMFHLDSNNQIVLFFEGERYSIVYDQIIYNELERKFA